MKLSLRPFALVAVLASLTAVAPIVSCSGATQVAKTVSDITTTACGLLENEPAGPLVTVVCDVVEGELKHLAVVQVPSASAAAQRLAALPRRSLPMGYALRFGAAPCASSASTAPAPTSSASAATSTSTSSRAGAAPSSSASAKR